MNTEEIREKRDRKMAMMMRYLSVIMAVFYLTLAAIISFTELFRDIAAQTRYLFSAMLAAYGLFRLYRVIWKR